MKRAPSEPRSALNNKDTSAQTQRLQILTLLREKQSVNTPEFRDFGIMAPAPRIFELREEGYRIKKILETYQDRTGKIHYGVARYYLSSNTELEYQCEEM
ncbi:helix-turn-helix domain-containing protein [Glaciecola sp. 1036]|uniref:helix-turn-helix domain-containing protein n=1 Tax=Alteromonadaceae TaxID=72275 RepID=UPI003D02D657